MTVRDVLKYTLSYYKNINENEIESYGKIFDVDLNKKMSELSLGTKKKVAIIQAIITKPKLLILDEPTNGLDPIVQNKLFEILMNLRIAGTTIFMSSHALDEVQKYCSKVAIIKDGKIIKEANISELLFHNSKSVKIKCSNSKKVSQSLKGDDVSQIEILDETTFSFVYSGDLNILLKKLSELDVEDIDITKVSLEDIFKSFYTDNKEVK
jgi:ABC-2 type transport system ATP-binding protein